MKILLTYDPTTELVEHTAKQIAEEVRRGGHDVDIVDLTDKQVVMLAKYDAIVLGGSVWFDRVDKKLVDYIASTDQELYIKPLYIFLHSYHDDDKFRQVVASELPANVLEVAHTFHLGLDVVVDELNPIKRLKWNMKHQKAVTPFDPQMMTVLVDEMLNTA